MGRRLRTRAEELAAIHDTVKILNDVDAPEPFKNIPSPALYRSGRPAKKKHANALLCLKSRSWINVQLLQMALQGKKIDFSNVIKMIDHIVALLAQ